MARAGSAAFGWCSSLNRPRCHHCTPHAADRAHMARLQKWTRLLHRHVLLPHAGQARPQGSGAHMLCRFEAALDSSILLLSPTNIVFKSLKCSISNPRASWEGYDKKARPTISALGPPNSKASSAYITILCRLTQRGKSQCVCFVLLPG